MSTQEQILIAELQELAAQGYMSAYELSWCLGAMRVRHGLSRPTRHQLRDTIRVILREAESRQSQDL